MNLIKEESILTILHIT